MQPLVTAVITNYNYARFLGDAVQSVLRQTYPAVEVIVVDDGSTDESASVISSFGNALNPIFQSNGGQAKAFETGIQAARGELISFLDADDVWQPTKVERMVAAAQDPECILAYHRVKRVDADLRPWGRTYPRATTFRDRAGRAQRSGGWWTFPPTSALTFRKSYLERLRPFPDAYRLCADAYIAGLAPYMGKVVGSRDVLTLYRLHGNNGWRGPVDRIEGLKRRAAMYELAVELTNDSLARLRIDRRVDLADHWPYRAVNCELEGKLRLSDAFLGLRFPGEKNPLRRVRDVGRTAWRIRRQKPPAEGG